MTREEEIKNEANIYAEKHGFRVPYDGSNDFYDKTDVKASLEGFIAGAKWADKTMIGKACEWLKNHLDEFWCSHYDDDKAFIEAFKQAMEEIDYINKEANDKPSQNEMEDDKFYLKGGF